MKINRGYKYIGVALLMGLLCGLPVYTLTSNLNLAISSFILPPLVGLLFACVGASALVIEDGVVPKSTVILSWALATAVSVIVFLIHSLSVSLAFVFILSYVLLNYYTRRWGRFVVGKDKA